MVEAEGNRIKLKIIAEGRIALEPPDYPHWSPVACLSLVDRIAEKLLANSDRWPDDSVFSRDLIDLGLIRYYTLFPELAIAKAEAVYPVVAPLQRALSRFCNDLDYQQRCFDQLQVRQPQQVLQGIEQLVQEFGIAGAED